MVHQVMQALRRRTDGLISSLTRRTTHMVIVQSLRNLGYRSAGTLALLAGSLNAWAALPTPVAPSTGPAAGNWLDLIKGYIKEGLFGTLGPSPV